MSIRRALSAVLAAVAVAALAAAPPASGSRTGDPYANRAGVGEPHARPAPAGPGGPGAGDSLFPHAGNGGYGVRHYDLALSYDPDTNRLDGVATLRLRAHSRLSRFDLDLADLRVTGIAVDNTAATWTRSAHELVITPARDMPVGAHTVVVRYRGVPRTHTDPDGSADGWMATDDGAVSVNEPLGAMTWFPVNNTLRDKATYRVAITVPAGLTAVSNGNLVSRSASGYGAQRTWVWRERDPMASYLSTVAVGEFDEVRGQVDGVPIRSFIDPRMDGAREVADQVAEVVRVWSHRFGPYPFSSAGVIIDRAGFGYALEAQTRPVFPYVPDMATLVHELAHQWYGDSVTPRDWSDIWLNEGFATYAEWVWEAREDPGAPRQHFAKLYEAPRRSELWSPPPADPGSGANLFGRPVYARGAMALQALRQRIGSSDFFTVLRRWAAEHRHGHGTTAELLQLSERVSGQQLGGLFRVWLYRDGKPRAW